MRTKAFFLASIILIGGAASSLSLAQVTTNITSSGLGTSVSPVSGGVVTITGGTRPGNGSNLFHSFGFFNVGAGNTANFFNDSGLFTQNILSRVTGGNPSNIFGTIQTTGFGSANLFLINPAGVVFGPNASLDIGRSIGTPGSFHVSTADYLRLGNPGAANAGVFSANPLVADVLTSAPVTAFGFLNSNPAAIAVQVGSTLQVGEGQSISIVGGNRTFVTDAGDTVPQGVTVTGGTLTAPGGQINLASMASPGEILNGSLKPALNVKGKSFTSFGSIHLAQGSTVDVSQSGSGKVSIRGGQVVLEIQNALLSTVSGAAPAAGGVAQDTITLSAGSAIVTNTPGADRGADIQIVAGSLQMDGASITASPGTDTHGQAGGNIDIQVGRFSATGLSRINSSTNGVGPGGTVRVKADESISLIDSIIASDSNSFDVGAGDGGLVWLTAPTIGMQGSVIGASTVGVGNAGDVLLEVGQLTLAKSPSLAGGSDILAKTQGFGSGNAGVITIRGLDGPSSMAKNVSLSGFSRLVSETIGGFGNEGNAGDIKVQTGRLTLSGGSQINTASRGGSVGNAGDITINATEGVTVSGQSEVTSGSIEFASGNGGRVTITSPSVVVENGGVISTVTDSPFATLPLNGNAGNGNAGEIEINAGTLRLSSGGQITSSAVLGDPGSPEFPPTGSAGNVTVQGLQGTGSAAGAVIIAGPVSGIFTSTVGQGPGGNIRVAANTVILSSGATISASSSGTVPNVPNPGDAGNVQIIASDSLVMQNGSITTATNQSDGGNIIIQAGRLVQLTNSQITTSVQGGLGNGGNITIDPQFVILSGSQILANAFGGNGGNIAIVAGTFLMDPTSTISASSTFGVSGTVNIQATVTNLSESVTPLSGEFVQTPELLQARCAARLTGGTASSFVVAGRDGIPLEPGGLLPSPLYVGTPESKGSPLALDIPGLRVGPAYGESSAALVPLRIGCAS